jgi:organic radical activating enzyme
MSKTFCPLPWMHLATHPEGKATLCCVSDHTNNMSVARTNGKVLNLNRNKVIEIMNSDYYVEVRNQMRQGIKPKSCLRCYNEEDMGIVSKRELETSRFGTDYRDNNGIIDPNLKFIELRLGNLCNVKCRTCNPASSTQWITEYNKLQNELSFVTHYDSKINTDWTQSDQFWEDLLENSKDVELIYINGGEPTLVEKHWNYLERLIDKGLNKQVKLWYSINMTNVPDKLINIWKQFKEVEVHGSVDDLGQRNSYIRKGTKWEDVEKSLKKIKENDWIKFSVTQTVSWMNIYYVDEFKKYFDNLNIPTQTNLVYDPKFYSICILPEHIKYQLQDKISNFGNLLNQVSTDINTELFNQGMIYNKWLDTHRNERFSEIFTEWSAVLGYK